VKNEVQDEVVSREEPEVCVVRWVLVFILASTQCIFNCPAKHKQIHYLRCKTL